MSRICQFKQKLPYTFGLREKRAYGRSLSFAMYCGKGKYVIKSRNRMVASVHKLQLIRQKSPVEASVESCGFGREAALCGLKPAAIRRRRIEYE
jgi:hypothetical protein